MPTQADLEWINEDLRALAYPIDKLELLPNNSNKGNVQATMASLVEFGQMEPIVCSLRPGTDVGVVLAGNTRLKAARQMGKKYIAVAWKKDGSEEHDLAYATADNSTARKGELDIEKELENIRRLEMDDALLNAAGYDLVGIEDLMAQISMEEPLIQIDDTDDVIASMESEFGPEPADEEEPEPAREKRPVIQYTLIFDTEEQQQLWYEFQKELKRKMPPSEGYLTHAQRLTVVVENYLDAQG